MQGRHPENQSLPITMVTPKTVTITLSSGTALNDSTEIISLRGRFESSKLRPVPVLRRRFCGAEKDLGLSACNFYRKGML